MRPAGEIRQALRACFPAQGQGVATWHDALRALASLGVVNPAAPSEARLVRRTVENMRAAGELRPGPAVAVPGVRRPMRGYARAAAPAAMPSNWATDWGQGGGQGGGQGRALQALVLGGWGGASA